MAKSKIDILKDNLLKVAAESLYKTILYMAAIVLLVNVVVAPISKGWIAVIPLTVGIPVVFSLYLAVFLVNLAEVVITTK